MTEPVRDDTTRRKPVPKPHVPPRRPLALPEVRELRELRKRLAFGGLPPLQLRTPEDHARIGAFRAIEELLAVLEEFRRRTERGDKCRLVEREHPRERGHFLVELVIEEVKS